VKKKSKQYRIDGGIWAGITGLGGVTMPLLLLPAVTQGVYLRLLADPSLGQSGLCRPPLDLLVDRDVELDQLGASGYISVCHELGVVYVRQAAAVVSSSPSVLRAVAAEVRQLTCFVVNVEWQNSCAAQNLH